MKFTPRLGKQLRSTVIIRIVAAISGLTLIAFPVAYVGWRDLASINLWFDESGQYWLALGLHHFSDPLAFTGGLAKMIEFGRVFNSDPGGFTFLLRGWISLFGSSPIALRSLPFLFFLLIPVIVLVSARRVGASPILAVVAASAPLGSVMLLHYATELRAYSMEACAVTFLFFVPAWHSEISKTKNIFVLGFVASLLVASRYSAFLYAAAACLVVILPLRSRRTALLRAFFFAAPIVLLVIWSYLIFARFQAGGSHRPPVYVEPYLLFEKDQTAILGLLRDNFLSQEGIAVTVFLGIAPLFAWFGPKGLAELRSIIGRMALFCLLSVVFVAVASLAGKLPWAVHTRWSIGYQALSASCFAMVLIMVTTWLRDRSNGLFGKGVLLLAACCFAIFWTRRLRWSVTTPRPYYETLGSHLQSIGESAGAYQLRLYVQTGASPTVRYLCEHGPLKGQFGYPKLFHIETADEGNRSSPISPKDFDVIVVTHLSFADSYRSRVTGGTVEQIGDPQPSCLLFLKK